MADVIMPKMGDAMEAGTVLAWKVKDGDSVKVGDVIAEIETDKSNVEIDVLNHAKAQASAPAKAAPAPAKPFVPAAGDEVIEPTQIRKVIARRMIESKTTIPHFYLTIEVDMNEIVALREQLNAYDASLVKISLNDMMVKAAGKALAKFPDVNAAYRDGKIVKPAGQHVGIAVALEDGLIVPVVRNASTLPLRELAKTTKDLIGKARDKKLQPSEYSGGTFTVSNMGGFDVDNFIAIIDPAQGAILAVSSIVKRPVVLDDDSIVVRQRMKLTLSGDHRIMDGATGAKFMQELKRLIQSPLSLME